MKLDLLTNATVVDDAIRFVAEHDRSKHKSINHKKEEVAVEQGMTNTVF
jgi:hypothetical protein